MINISLAMDFSRNPSARTEEEGKNSGIKFREILTPQVKTAIETKQKILVDLDGTNGMGTSFLEEVFGGLIREEHIAYEDLKKYLDFISNEEPDLIEEIWGYIEDAYQNEKV